MPFSSSSTSTRSSPLHDPLLLLQPSDDDKNRKMSHAELALAAQASAAAADSFIKDHSHVPAAAGGDEEHCWHVMEQEEEEEEGHYHHHQHHGQESSFDPNSSSNSGHDNTSSSSPSWIMIWLGTTANLCSATLGCGVLALPAACAQTGIILAAGLTLVAALATIYSIHLLVRACSTYSLYSYESLTLHCLGMRWRRAVEFFMLMFCQGTAVAYLIAVCDILQQSHLLLFHNSRTWTLVVVWILVELPLSLNRRMTHLQMASVLGIAAIFTLIIAAFVHLLDDQAVERKEQQHHNDINKDWTMHDMLWPNQGNIISAITACPIILFAFSCQVNVCAIFQELPSVVVAADNSNNNRSPRRYRHSRRRQQQQQQNEDDNNIIADQENVIIHDNNNTNNHGQNDNDERTQQQHPVGQRQEVNDSNDNDENTQKQRLMSIVTFSAVLLCTLLYASISAVVLLDFGPATTAKTPNLLQLYHLHGHTSNNDNNNSTIVNDGNDDNGDDDNDGGNSNSTSLMQVAAMAMAVAVVVAFPLNIFPARVTLAGIFCSSSTTTNSTTTTSSLPSRRRHDEHDNTIGDSLTANENLTAALLEDYPQQQQQDETLSTLQLQTSKSTREQENTIMTTRRQEPTENNNITTPPRRKNNRAGQATAAAASRPEPIHQSAQSPMLTDHFDETKLSCFNHVALTLLLAGSALGMALVVPDISTVFSILGGTASSFLGFIIPGLLGLKLHEHDGDSDHHGYCCLPVVLSWLLILFGIVMGILTTGATIYSLIHK